MKSGNNIRVMVRRILRNHDLNFRENVVLKGGVEWTVDFYSQDYNAVILCCECERDFLEKFIECQDLLRNGEYTCILVTGKFSIPLKILQLSALNGIVIVESEKIMSIPRIVRGEGVELNWGISIVERRTPRRMVLECEEKILEMLRNIPLTMEEIVDALGGMYPHRTIKWCISKLKGLGKIIVLARVSGSGRAIYATHPNQISIALKRYKISKSWIRRIKCELLIEELKKAKDGATIRELTERLNWKTPQTIAILRHLKGRRIVYGEVVDGKLIWRLKEEELSN